MKPPITLTCRTLIVAATFLMTTVTANAQWSNAPGEELYIRGGWLFDSVADTRRRNSGIVIRNGVIVEVDANIQQQVLNSANVIDLQDSQTILPGMIDCMRTTISTLSTMVASRKWLAMAQFSWQTASPPPGLRVNTILSASSNNVTLSTPARRPDRAFSHPVLTSAGFAANTT